MKSKINTELVEHLLLQECLKFEHMACVEDTRPDGTEEQSTSAKVFNRATFAGRAQAYRKAAETMHTLAVMLAE